MQYGFAIDQRTCMAAAICGTAPVGSGFIARIFASTTVLHVLMEYGGNPASKQAGPAADMITHWRYSRLFWFGGVLTALVAAALAFAGWGRGTAVIVALGGLIVQGALLAYEAVFVRAGQDVPLS